MLVAKAAKINLQNELTEPHYDWYTMILVELRRVSPHLHLQNYSVLNAVALSFHVLS